MPTIKQGSYTVSSGRTSAGIAAPAANTSMACCCPSCAGLQCLDRTRFFAGQLLSEADLNNEQSYWLAKSRLHNRYLNGWGVVCGMQVICGQCDGWVTVQSGYAIDPCGNDIIVCASQNFNVLQAIQQCCAPAKQQTANCSPLRYNPSPTCKDSLQEWCITIQYQEQASRLVTPLSNSTQSANTCGCGSSNGNGKGSGGSASSSNGCCCKSCSTATQSPTTTVPAGSCEATRIVEGFQLGVIPAAEVAASLAAPNPNSLKTEVEMCLASAATLVEQAPVINANTSAQSAYQSTCNYLALVTQYLSAAGYITLCTLLDDLSAIKVPSGADYGTYVGIVAQIKQLIVAAFLNCVCYTVIPPCPAPPCDNRIVLACVTIQNGKIIQICHFPGRKQLITLQTLGYWLGPLGLDNLGTILSDIFAILCCGVEKNVARNPVSASSFAYYNETMTTAGITSGADVNRIAAHYLSQNFGAAVVNAISPGARAVDLRPMVNLPTETVQANLREQGFKSVTLQAVDDDPAWNADAIAASAQFAPAAVSAGQPLKVYTNGNVAVGFDVIDRTTAKIQDLQNQITALQGQMNQAKPA